MLLANVLVAALFMGCFDDPVRDHPLDPLGENFIDKGNIIIRVTSFYPPLAGLNDIEIQVAQPPIIGQTNEQGEYRSPDLGVGTYQVTISGEGYASIDTLVSVTAGESSRLDIPLPGLPVFSAFELHSLHLSRWFPPPEELFSLEIVAELDDLDGLADIDSLWLVSNQPAFKEEIFVEVTPGRYVHSIPSGRLSAGLVALQGREFQLLAKDRSGEINWSAPRSMIRVIEETPLALDPDNLTVLTESLPTFNWAPIALQYPFTFRLDIVQINQNVESIVQTIESIPATDTTITAATPLLAGNYFWTISVVDEFGNRSRSREAGFRIQ